jgi:hypothetical protein
MPLSGRRARLSRRSGRLSATAATPADRCCPVSLALCAGAYWRALEARGLVRRLTGPFLLVAAPACTNRWFSTPAPGCTRPDHSPYFDVGRSLRALPGGCQLEPRRVAKGRGPTARPSGRRSSATDGLRSFRGSGATVVGKRKARAFSVGSKSQMSAHSGQHRAVLQDRPVPAALAVWIRLQTAGYFPCDRARACCRAGIRLNAPPNPDRRG